ncbi:MAG TPA: ABC transporter ATP-binding protein, partial [Pirellulaceae bacterium]|nr:ABC transporter ATP-binding protein [Pirellulaceae bacterium]
MVTTRPANPTLPASSPPQITECQRLEPAIRVQGVSHAYGSRLALDDLSLEVSPGELLAVLGPNGGGKSTLFRLLSTLLPLSRGSASVLGYDLRTQAQAVRSVIGVVFQAPSLDRKLTVAENIRLQAALYGLGGRELKTRLEELLDQFALRERARELTERLSGGLRRRVELAKGLIHRPAVLLLDEPSTGLDPAARSDLWQYLRRLKTERGTTIVLTTHYLDEADGADRIAILNEGRLVALGPPDELRASVGGDSITLETNNPDQLAAQIAAQFPLPARVIDEAVRLETPDGHHWIAKLVEAFPGEINAVRLGKPTLED